MNAKVNVTGGKATVDFRSNQAKSLSSNDIDLLKAELRGKGVNTLVVNTGRIVEASVRLLRILEHKAKTGGTWKGLNIWATGNPKNPFVLTGNI